MCDCLDIIDKNRLTRYKSLSNLKHRFLIRFSHEFRLYKIRFMNVVYMVEYTRTIYIRILYVYMNVLSDLLNHLCIQNAIEYDVSIDVGNFEYSFERVLST